MDNSAGQRGKAMNMDTVKRPVFVSEHADLIRFGSEQEPSLVWAEFVSPLTLNGKVYDHIYGIRFYYTISARADTVYYENLEIRSGSKNPDLGTFKMVRYQADESNISITNGKDTIDLFTALETHKYDEEYNGLKLTNMPSIRKVGDGFIYGGTVEYNLQLENEKQYTLSLRDGATLHYRLCAECHEVPEDVSFINRENGRIYFIQKNCYLDLIDMNDLSKLKGDD